MSFLLVSFAVLAQQGPVVESYWKNHWKSLLKKEMPPAQVAPAPGAQHISSGELQRLLKNRAQSLDIIETPGDSVRIAKLDNMPVSMPDMRRVEKMPGSHTYTLAPPSKMPNPLYPRKK